MKFVRARLHNSLVGWAILFLGFVTLSLGEAATANDNLYARSYPATGVLSLKVQDLIDSPIYSWPRTLLTYSVDFSQVKIKPDRLLLTNVETGKSEPFQLSKIKTRDDGTLSFACLSFFTDLTPGAVHTFTLGANSQPSSFPELPETVAGGVIEVDSGTLKVRLPVSRTDSGSGNFPAPILGLNLGAGWCGGGRIASPRRAVKSLETKCIESGALFRTYQMTYQFEGGGCYLAQVRIVQGYPYVDLTETMTGLAPEDHAAMEFDWDGFSAMHRFAANTGGWLCPPEGFAMDEPIMTEGIIEEPHWFPADYVENPAKDMLFHLAAFQGNGIREAVPAMSFSEDGPVARELGVFVPDAAKWDDGQYEIWSPSTLLQVRFRYENRRLIWTYPLLNGKRETGITLHDLTDGVSVVEAMRETYRQAAGNDKNAFAVNGSFGYGAMPMRYALWLRSWYGGLSLDKVKDWVLSVPDSEKAAAVPETDAAPDAHSKIGSASSLVDDVYHSSLMLYPLGLNVGVDAISHRSIRPTVQAYLKYQAQFTPDQRQRINAVLLLSAYVNSGDDLAPLRCCLSGTPNISADGFSVPSELAVLFPKHPMMDEWADQFQKRVQLMGCYYTRPEVAANGSLGGRWCESLSTYNWAYLDPTETAQTSLTLANESNRMANFWMAERGRWLVDELTAPIYNPNPMWRQNLEGFAKEQAKPAPSPWQPGIDLTAKNGFERQYPPHGAHGSGSGIVVQDKLGILAASLVRYDPLTAEHLFWAVAQRTSSEKDEPDPYWEPIGLQLAGNNIGTEPQLRSCKYTGHGIILRAGVDTPEELSIHLDQVDQGPNYRWGNNGEGSSGVLYFYGGGQPWSGHERENTGDHSTDDASGFTTFATVYRGELRSIGENTLEQPLYDLGASQFGEITARHDLNPYSWPAYRSRSVMLVGTDYFILCDDAIGDNRFTWCTMKDLPFPKIVFLKPLGARGDHWTEMTTNISKGFIRDAGGPSIVLVSHKKDGVEMEKMKSSPIPYIQNADVQQYAWALPRGEKPVAGVFYIKAPASHDVVFRDVKPISYNQNGMSFSGNAGVIRNRTDGTTELALFHGSKIAAKGLTLTLEEDSGLGIGATFKTAGQIAGTFFAPKSSRLTLQIPSSVGDANFYIDGAKQELHAKADSWEVDLPSGRHSWEWTSGLPTPGEPEILRTTDKSAGASVFFAPVPGADRYRLEMSKDGGAFWQPAAQGSSCPLELSGLANRSKIHVRLIAGNAQHESAPSAQYPIYVTDQAPAAPEGMDLELGRDRIDLTWGEILGASEYRLYRRDQHALEWKCIYAGPDRAFPDTGAVGTVPPVALPGRADNALTDSGSATIYEYAVTAVNGNGEGVKSKVESSDPANWRNWWPAGQERKFKRQTGYWLPPYVSAESVPPLHYSN